MSEWTEYKLGDLIEKKGYIRGPFGSSLKRSEMKPKGYAVYEQQHAIYNTRDFRYYIDQDKFNELNRFRVLPNDLIISCSGTVGQVSIINESDPIGIISQALLTLRPNIELVSPKFLFYFFKTRNGYNQILNASHGSVQVNIAKREVVESIPILVPNRIIQDEITELLSSIDDKIELNNKINQELESLAQLLFKRWFVDFEFPNEKGEPYKSSGGEMVDSELGEIPKGWEIKKLNDIANCYDNKRIPLSSMERAKRKGIYPYYGAASLMDFVDDFIFDGTYVLMGEDGSVINESGFPILQYVYGKFWVNNHAHVLEGKLVSTEFILCLLRITNISDLVTGAVQPKLNQGNMNKISIALPKDLSEISEIEGSFNHFYQLIRSNLSEIINLTSLRDFLLPKLISGELQINDN
jgi:type I restriction enzyme S subunit